MSDILLLGLSHYPPLAWPDQQMSVFLKRMLQNPDLPDHLREPEGWPAGMREEWGDDEGTTAAGRHREAMLKWLRKTRAALDAFDPDFVVIWGDDQYENFHEDIVPPYCVFAHDEFRFHNWKGNIWGDANDKEFILPGVPHAGKMLTTKLIEAGFDMSYSYKPLHHPLGHAFTNAYFYLDYDRKGFDYPILPISVNCYGRHVICQKGGLPKFDKKLTPDELDPPAPTPRRLFDLGAETARIFSESPYRVALIASSGWSHAFLTPKNHLLYPDREADQMLFDALAAGDYETWRNYPASAVEQAGQQEVLNWMCLAGAMKELGRTADEMGFVDTWIFNSSKSFLVSAP